MITIVVPERVEESVAVCVSPLLECVLSLHVLVGPRHHALQHDWVRRMRSLDRALRKEAEALAFVYRRQVPDLFLPGAIDAGDGFETELAQFLRLPPELLLESLARPLYDHGGAGASVFQAPDAVRIALDRAGEPGGPERRAAELLFDDPVAFAERLARFAEAYWNAAFAVEWSRIEERLSNAVVDAGRQLAAVGLLPLLGRLPPHCWVAPSRHELYIDLPHDHVVEVSPDLPLVLIPSFFVWPHLRVNCDSPWPVALVYTAQEFARAARPRVPEAQLLRTLRALADDTRLRVLKLVAERPRTTQELEPLVGLSRAGLSKSLLRLAEVGLITPKREGYYVVYSLARDRLDALAEDVAHYLDG